MRLINNMYIKLAITCSLILGMGATSFAGNTISDVPSSASEMRPIQRQTTPYTDSCDIEQDLAFYDGSPVYLRVGQPQGTIHYVFDKTETYVMVYNQDLFEGNLKFPYVANFVPSATFESDNSNILTVEATGANFAADSSIDRDEIAGQIITKNMERAAIQSNNGATLSYYYKLANTSFTPRNGTIKINIHPQITPKTSCTNYYIARCGDGIIDDEDTDGIEVDGDTINRHARSLEANEVCDDGAQNGQPGKCKTDCSGIAGTVPTGGATCTFTATPSNIEAGQPVTLNAGYTSGASATFSPATTFTPAFSSPTWNGSATVNPTTTTTYTMNVAGANGLSGTTCTTTVNVTAAPQRLSCALSFSQNPVVPGQIVNVGWNVTGGNFVGTYIYVNPTITGWPHAVNANQYNGVTQAVPSHTGDYLFSFHIFNNDNTQTTTCTGLLHVVENKPAKCSLTTTTPIINAGQTAIINGQYNNSVLSSIYPNISGVNFTYPNRSQNNMHAYPTVSTTYTMVVQNEFGEQSKCGVRINVINTGLSLSKQLVTDQEYQSGDLVTFRINFANNSASTIENVVLSDYLPPSLSYVSSQLYGVAPYTFATGIVEGHHFVQYSGFSLTPGQNGYLIIAGRFNGNGQQTLNNAFIKGDYTPTVYASALFTARKPSANATIVKTSNKPSYYPGEAALFTLAVTNNGPDAITSLTITDIWPTSPYITLDPQWSANQQLNTATTNNPYSWTYTGNIGVGQTVYLYLTGHISNDPAAIGTYTNNANIAYSTTAQNYTGSANPLVFTVSATPSSTMIFEKRIISQGTNPGDPIVFELLYRNNGSATISNYNIVDYRPATLTFVSANPTPTTQSPVANGTELRRYFPTSLAPNATGKITINGMIK